MKLTKEIVDILKFHGYMTFTENTETFLNAFKTVEQLGDAGFITDRGAIDFLNTIFDENGVNRVAEISETNLNEGSINPEIVNSVIQDSLEPETEQMKEQEQEPETEQMKEQEQEPETEQMKEQEPETEQMKEQEQEKVKEKKTTTKTTKKTTKKES